MDTFHDSFYTDPLTGLPNINYLHQNGEERIQAIWDKGFTPAFMYFDLDSMQSYNSRYGFKAGDELLKLTAKILHEVFIGSMLMRGADDHFILITALDAPLESKHLKTEEELLAKSIEKVNKRLVAEAPGVTTGCHAGICVLEKGQIPHEALDHARQACKALDGDLSTCYKFFTVDDHNRFVNERYIVENLHQAISEGWFKVYYQAILRIETEKAFGFEALARWDDPVLGLISPAVFIPPLTKYHLMHLMDLHIFEKVCQEVKERYDAGLPLLPVSVNFSGRDFDYMDMVTELNRIVDSYHIEQYGIDKSFFVIEITEQDIATATDSFRQQLKDLRESGFQVWLDDFGSAYSSLNVFSRFDFDLIKFDMDLLKNLDDPKGANREIISAIIGVAKRLGMQTLCEGMETEKQKRFLLSVGCEMGQGFLYHKPESLEPIFDRLHRGLEYPPCETDEEREYFTSRINH